MCVTRVGCDCLHPQGKTRRTKPRPDRFLGQVKTHTNQHAILFTLCCFSKLKHANEKLFSHPHTPSHLHTFLDSTDSYKKRKKGFGSKKPAKTHANGNLNVTHNNNTLKQLPVSSTSLASTGNSSGGPLPPAPQPQQHSNGGGTPVVAEKKKHGFISKLFGRK